MHTKRRYVPLFCCLLLARCLTGCAAPALPDSRQTAVPQSADLTAPLAAAAAIPESAAANFYAASAAGATAEIVQTEPDCPDRSAQDNSPAKTFAPYAPFGLLYDADTDALYYQGQRVRWFEDCYPVTADGAQAGRDHFDASGTVDVHAVRDRSSLPRRADGSYDPGGTLTGVEAFSAQEFAARDLQALQNPQPVTATAGGALTAAELAETAAEYAAFGVSYAPDTDQWYYNGEKVRCFQDVLTSNGASLTGGGFRGTLRSFAGTVDIYTVRDFTRPNTDGNGTLLGIEVCSQQEFDRRTQECQTAADAGMCEVKQG